MRFTFTGECRHPEQQIHSCQNVGSQFLIANQKFNITYKQCQGMDWTANKGKMLFIIHSMYALFLTVSKWSKSFLKNFISHLVVEYSCLGDWFVGKNHFFAVANTKESRKDEKYRCFLKNREDDYYLGASITPECNSIKTVEKVRVNYLYLWFPLFLSYLEDN